MMAPIEQGADAPRSPEVAADPRSRVAELLGQVEPPAMMTIKHVDIVQAPVEPVAEPMAEAVAPATDVPPPLPDVPLGISVEDEPAMAEEVEQREEPPAPEPLPAPAAPAPMLASAPAAARLSGEAIVELWEQECRAARRKLEPEGALTGATRELQAGLGAFLSVCHEHGVKVGPWRLQHVVDEWSYGDHPTYGVVTLAHWACKDGQPWKVGIGLFLARGAGKPKDLEVKLAVMDTEPMMVDHLILLRPEDDLAMAGKSKTLLQDAERRGRHARLEPVSLDGFAQLYAFPRWLAAVREGLPAGLPVPNLADVIQEKCEKLLEQVCMPVQG
jgi:hypothetical protein